MPRNRYCELGGGAGFGTIDSNELVGTLADDHELSRKARAYGERVVTGDRWPLDEDDVDRERLTWATSTRAKRRHGNASYEDDGRVTITVSEHTYDRGGFDACEGTVRHELVHAWQHQRRGATAIVTEAGVVEASYRGEHGCRPDVRCERHESERSDAVRVSTGHGESFTAWTEPLDLDGRCSSRYEKTPADYTYVYECPECGDWWGKHRLCKSVRQAAHGDEGPTGYRYCTGCEAQVHLRSGDEYLEHGAHSDDEIRAFVAGDGDGLPTVCIRDADPKLRPASDG